MEYRSSFTTARRSLIAIVAAIATTLAFAAAAAAASGLSTLVEVDTSYDGMGTGALEWSGATYNADRNVLVTVDDERTAYEFDLNADGSIDHGTPARIIDLDLGGRSDYEGVAWISGETYAFLSEDVGEVLIVDVPIAATSVTMSDVASTFDAAPGGFLTNLGPEGIATDGSSFYIVKEMPATLTKFDMSGTWQGQVSLTELADASGVAVAADGTLLVVSHESRVVSHYSVDWDAETTVQIGSLDASLFTQLEGIALIGNDDMHLFGELKSGGKTHAQYEGSIVTGPTYLPADVNCSGDVNVGDAILITRFQAGTAEATPGCGSGDINGDGSIDVGDALVITQCDAGLVNPYC